MFPRSRRRWLVGVALFAAGCLSPTLPLPPPSEPMITATTTEGLVRFQGTVLPQSEVFALDHNSNLIAGQYTESGQYDFKMAALAGDSMSFWYVHDTVESTSAEFILRPAAPASP
ncbi:MAG: hypothetical protein ABW061_17620 [Polyangiaceae bacterium]